MKNMDGGDTIDKARVAPGRGPSRAQDLGIRRGAPKP